MALQEVRSPAAQFEVGEWPDLNDPSRRRALTR